MDRDSENPVERAIADPQVTKIYANGFHATIGIGDILLVLTHNGNNAAVLNLSYTVAKTLAEALDGLNQKLEARTGHEIMTTHEVRSKFAEEDGE